MKKLPNGISNYEELKLDNRIYIDKTMYIEKLEHLSDKTIMFLYTNSKHLFIKTF